MRAITKSAIAMANVMIANFTTAKSATSKSMSSYLQKTNCKKDYTTLCKECQYNFHKSGNTTCICVNDVKQSFIKKLLTNSDLRCIIKTVKGDTKTKN